MAGEVIQPEVQSFNASARIHKNVTFGPFSTSGTSTAADATTLTDAGANWATDTYIGQTVYSDGKTGVITTNSDTVATVSAWVGGTPTAVKPYGIGAAGATGDVGTVRVALASGVATPLVIIRSIVPFVTTAVDSANHIATAALGFNGSTSFFVAATTVSGFSLNSLWTTTTPTAWSAALPSGFKDVLMSTHELRITIAVEVITSGTIGFDIFYDPLIEGSVLI